MLYHLFLTLLHHRDYITDRRGIPYRGGVMYSLCFLLYYFYVFLFVLFIRVSCLVICTYSLPLTLSHIPISFVHIINYYSIYLSIYYIDISIYRGSLAALKFMKYDSSRLQVYRNKRIRSLGIF